MGNEYEKDNNIIETSPEDEDLMLPDGYGADDDIFADPQNWTGKQADESAGQSGDGEGTGDGAEGAPTTAQETAQDVTGSDHASAPTTEPPAPTTAQGTADTPNMLKFRAKLDHNERDVELKESELPEIWQKAQNHDRMRSRMDEMQAQLQSFDGIARTMGYANAKEMAEKAADEYRNAEVKSLMDEEGVPERIAKAVVASEMRERNAAAPAQAPTQTAPQRDPKAEVAELLAAKPEMRGKQLPPEVLAAWSGGKNLLTAYSEYEAAESRREAERLRTENNIHKQNAANAAKAPIKSATAGGAPGDSKGEDFFLNGFNADY